MNYRIAEQKRSSAEEKESRSAVVQQSSRLEDQSPFTLHASPFTTNYFYFLNAHGNVTYFSDANFTPEKIESYEYTPWGFLLTSASKNNLLYTEREFDFETGLQFNRIRYYSPILGRFMIKDLKISKNYYKAFKSNPLNYRDVFGLQDCVLETLLEGCASVDPCNSSGIDKCRSDCINCCINRAGIGSATVTVAGTIFGIMGGLVAGFAIGLIGGAFVTYVEKSCKADCESTFTYDPKSCQGYTSPPPGTECPQNAPNCDPIT